MKKYFLIWLVTGLVGEFIKWRIECFDSDQMFASMHDWAMIINPYALMYMGYEPYSQSHWIVFIQMHAMRFIWLMTAGGLEYYSYKVKFLKYIAWFMLFLYFLPSYLALFCM